MTAALCFAAAGRRVAIFEQAAEFGEVGAGIQISPNAARVLHRLGLEGALAGGAEVAATEIRHWRGRLIAAQPLDAGLRARHGFPYYHLHRADLLRALVDAVAAEPGIELYAGAPVRGVTRGAAGVVVTAGGDRHAGALLIGADGIHSTVRALAFGADRATFTGHIAWRALIPAGRLAAALRRPVATLWWGPGRHLVHYPIRAGSLVNCVAVVEDDAPWRLESWSAAGDPAELRRHFGGWHEPVPALLAEVDAAACYRWALFDRRPMARWSTGRITLLGDACHPMLPFLAQGAAMAIEDAAVLARCVQAAADVEAGLRAYEGPRRRRTARLQRASRRNARIFHMRGVQAWARDRIAGPVAARMLDRVFRHDVYGGQ